jgi:hypothetical protein
LLYNFSTNAKLSLYFRIFIFIKLCVGDFALILHVVHSWPSGGKSTSHAGPLAGDVVLHSTGPPGWECGTTNPSPLAGDEVLLPQPGGWKVNNSVKSAVKMCDTRINEVMQLAALFTFIHYHYLIIAVFLFFKQEVVRCMQSVQIT